MMKMADFPKIFFLAVKYFKTLSLVPGFNYLSIHIMIKYYMHEIFVSIDKFTGYKQE